MTTLLPDKIFSLTKVNNSKLSNVRFHCEYTDCQKSYTKKQNLEVHVLTFHENRRFHCEYPDCQKSYKEKRNLNHHVLSYHENRRIHCEQPNCEASYSNQKSLTRHNKTDHQNLRHTCAGCDKKFKHRYGLRYHIKVQKCQQTLSKTEKDEIDYKIEFLEKHLADIDSQIHTVAALISGFESFELKCDDCFSNK